MKNFHKILIIFFVFVSLAFTAKSFFHNSLTAFSPQIAHAAEPKAMDLHDDFVQSTTSQGWMFTVWKTTLGLADIFVVVVLLFLAIVNIVHIQYDTYAIKKSLPTLIIGVVMANFSMLIVRMIVDVAQVLSNTFIGQDPHAFVDNLLCSIALNSSNGFAAGILALPSLILIIIFGFLLLVGIVIAAFLLYIRFVVLYALAAVAPLAFIMLAFPPTQSIFKKWWGWFSQWVFLAPIMMFIFWMASLVGAGNCGDFHLTAMILALALIYVGCLVPFKMGGAVMSAWGGAGKWLTGTGKGGYARKRVDNWWGRRKTAIGNAAIARIPFAKRTIGASELDKENVENRRKQLIGEGKTADERRKGDKYQRQRMLTEEAERDLKKYQDEAKRRISEGSNVEESEKIRKSQWARWRYKAQTGVSSPGEMAYRWAKSSVEAQRAAEAVSKSAQWDLFAKLSEDMNLDQKLKDDLKKLLNANFKELDDIDVDVKGTVRFNPDIKVGANDYTGWAEHLEGLAAFEENPEIKTNMLQGAQEIRRRETEYKATTQHRPNGLRKFKVDENTGKLAFSGEIGSHWGDYMYFEDQLRLEAKTVRTRNPEKAKALLESADQLHQEAAQWQKANPTYIDENGNPVKIDYGAYLDRNKSGRQLKLLTPLLIDEMHTNAQNENIDSFIDMLNNGGGFGNVRYMAGKMQKFVQGKSSELSANEINACMAVLGGIKERINMSPDRSDAQELLQRFMGTMTKGGEGGFLGPELWHKMLGKLEGDRKGSLGQFAYEYTREQQKRGEKSENWLIKDLTKDDTVATVNERYLSEQIMSMIPVDVIGKIVPTGGAGANQRQREFYRRVVTQIMQMPEFGGGKNPAMFAGQTGDRPGYQKYETLKPRPGGEEGPEETAGGVPIGGGPGGAPAAGQVQKPEEQRAIAFASQTPEQIVHQADGVDQALSKNYQQIRYIFDMKPGLATKLVEGGIDINSDEFNTVLDQLASLQPNIDHAQLQAELGRIAPNLKFKLDSNIPVSTYIENARIVRNGERTTDTLVRESVSSDYVPYVQAAPKNANDLTQAISSLEGSFNRLEEVISDMNTSGRSMSRNEIDELKNIIGQTPPGRLEISKQSILDNLESGNASQALNIIEKTLTGFRTAKNMPIEERTDEEKIKRGIMAGFEAEWIREKQRRQAESPTPPAQPPAGTAPTPGAPTPAAPEPPSPPQPPPYNPSEHIPRPGQEPPEQT